jgi:RNA polymerase sigma-70 factor (ECF subfamily)
MTTMIMSGPLRGPTGAARDATIMSSTRRMEQTVTNRTDFAAFYAATFHSLCAQLYAHTGDLAEAQDVVQEAFCRALPRWDRLVEYDDPTAWVRKVAWNLATSRWRRVRKLADITRRHVEQTAPSPSPDRVALRDALSKLPERHRQAIILHYLADASVAEIARITGSAEGTVKSWLHRGRATLAAHLGNDFLTEGVQNDA